MALRPGQPVQTSSETKFLIGEYDLLDYVSDFVDYSPTTGLVDFSHKSIRQFLTDPGTRASYFKDWEPRTYLTGACLQYLSDDKVWIEQPLDPEEAKDHLKQRDERFPFADYADRLWAHHAQGDPESSLHDTILSFLKRDPILPMSNGSSTSTYTKAMDTRMSCRAIWDYIIRTPHQRSTSSVWRRSTICARSSEH